MPNPALHAGEIGLMEAAQRLGLSKSSIIALLHDHTIEGGRRTVRRATAVRPWSQEPSHAVYFVLAASVEDLRMKRPGLLADLQQRRARRARARRLGFRRAAARVAAEV